VNHETAAILCCDWIIGGHSLSQIPPARNVSVETGSLASTPLTGTVIDTPAAPQLDQFYVLKGAIEPDRTADSRTQ